MKYTVLLLLFTCGLAAQNKTPKDTIRYEKFRSNLIIGVFQAYRNFNNEFSQNFIISATERASNNYYAESNLITGIEVSYDKLGIAIGLKSTPQEFNTGKGNTKTLNANVNFGGNIWFVENSVRYFKGFYDQNTVLYDSSFKKSGNYLLQPNFVNTLVRNRFLYFTNHKKYACKAGFACNYRQRKSAATWVLSVVSTYNYLRNDSSFFPLPTRAAYGDYGSMNALKVFGISFNAGAAATIVLFKALFINVMAIVGPEQQWRRYTYADNGSTNLSYISINGSVRASIGVNFKRCYFSSSSLSDFTYYNSSFVGIKNRSLSGGFIFGWRFNSKTPDFYKKFQKTKIYLAL